MKTIAIDLDDTLNLFTETLQQTPFAYDAANGLSEDTFHSYLARMRSGEADSSGLLSNEYSSFCGKITSLCHELAPARPDAVQFMQWLRAHQWRIVICTFSDLRADSERIQKWLAGHQIPYDYLFMSVNKLEFCRAWKIGILVDDHVLNIQYGSNYGIQVFYPILPKHQGIENNGARGFNHFNEITSWIQS